MMEADKEASRQRALQLFPDQAANLSRRKDHARAEAMLLAFMANIIFTVGTTHIRDSHNWWDRRRTLPAKQHSRRSNYE
jgi:hypothetical protein